MNITLIYFILILSFLPNLTQSFLCQILLKCVTNNLSYFGSVQLCDFCKQLNDGNDCQAMCNNPFQQKNCNGIEPQCDVTVPSFQQNFTVKQFYDLISQIAGKLQAKVQKEKENQKQNDNSNPNQNSQTKQDLIHQDLKKQSFDLVQYQPLKKFDKLDPQLQKAIIDYFQRKKIKALESKKQLINLTDEVKYASYRFKIFKEYPDKYLVMLNTLTMGIKINLKLMTPQEIVDNTKKLASAALSNQILGPKNKYSKPILQNFLNNLFNQAKGERTIQVETPQINHLIFSRKMGYIDHPQYPNSQTFTFKQTMGANVQFPFIKSLIPQKYAPSLYGDYNVKVLVVKTKYTDEQIKSMAKTTKQTDPDQIIQYKVMANIGAQLSPQIGGYKFLTLEGSCFVDKTIKILTINKLKKGKQSELSEINSSKWEYVPQCRQYDQSIGDWTEEGVTTSMDGFIVECHSKKFQSMAIFYVQNPEKKNESPSIGLILGIISSILIIAFIITLVVLILRRRKKNRVAMNRQKQENYQVKPELKSEQMLREIKQNTI